MKLVDLAGKKIGDWSVLWRSSSKGDDVRWDCRCKCGVIQSVSGRLLRRGGSLGCRSCGRKRD